MDEDTEITEQDSPDLQSEGGVGTTAAQETDEDEDILPLDHDASLPPEINKTIRIAKQRGKKLRQLETRLAELEAQAGEYGTISEAINRGDLVFRRDVEREIASREQAPELADGSFGDPDLDEAYDRLSRQDPEGTKKLFRTIAGLRKQIAEVTGHVSQSAAQSVQSRMRSYLAGKLAESGVTPTPSQFERIAQMYAADVTSKGYTLGAETQVLSSTVLKGILTDLNVHAGSRSRTTDSASPSTTGRRGAPLTKPRSPKGAPMAVMTKDAILAEIRAGNL